MEHGMTTENYNAAFLAKGCIIIIIPTYITILAPDAKLGLLT